MTLATTTPGSENRAPASLHPDTRVCEEAGAPTPSLCAERAEHVFMTVALPRPQVQHWSVVAVSLRRKGGACVHDGRAPSSSHNTVLERRCRPSAPKGRSMSSRRWRPLDLTQRGAGAPMASLCADGGE